MKTCKYCYILKIRRELIMKNENFSREGYLHENYHYFHLKDTAGQERDFHFHEFDKIVLLLSGSVEYVVENRSYELKPWTVLLVKHHAIHKAIIDKKEPYERVIIYMDRKYFDRLLPYEPLSYCFEHSDKPGQQLLKPDENQKKLLKTLLQAYERAEKDRQFGAEALRDTIIMQMLILMGRMSAAGDSSSDSGYDPKIQEALTYINENLNRDLSVESLAEHVYLSKYHFMRTFKTQTGSTVHAYIRQKRLLYASRLIREGMAVNEAAAESGFSDYSAFHRAFKESFGVSPGQIKK